MDAMPGSMVQATPSEASVLHFITEVLLEQIKTLFDDRGIEFLVLKGPHLAYTVYENPGERTWCDLDLLVAPDAFGEAMVVMASAGHIVVPGNDPSQARGYYCAAFSSPLSMVVELHQALAEHGRYPVNVKEWFRRARPFRLGKTEALGLCPEDLLLALCIHAAKGFFQVIERKHILDLARVTLHDPIDWKAFCVQAAKCGCAGAAYYALLAARHQEGARVPDDVLDTLRPGRLRRRWLGQFLDPAAYPIFTAGNVEAWWWYPFVGLPLIDRKRDWVRLAGAFTLLRLRDLPRRLKGRRV